MAVGHLGAVLKTATAEGTLNISRPILVISALSFFFIIRTKSHVSIKTLNISRYILRFGSKTGDLQIPFLLPVYEF
jgi:hypothetical protein